MLPHQTTSHQHHDYRVIIIQADLLKNISEWYGTRYSSYASLYYHLGALEVLC